MSESQPNPFASMMQMQKRAVEQSQQAVHEGVKMQKQMLDAFVDGLETQESVQRKGSDAARTAYEASIDAMSASVPGGRSASESTRRMVDDQFAAADDLSEQTWTAIEEGARENADAFDAYLEGSLDLFDESVSAYLDYLAEFDDFDPEDAVGIDFDDEQ